MNLKRTTIIPLDDASLAASIFNSFIEKEMMILMVIIGDTQKIRESILKADNLAKLSYFNMERWVLWIRDHQTLRETLSTKLSESDDPINTPYDDIQSFCFSPILDKATAAIHKDVSLNYASLQQVFYKAQSHDTTLSGTTNSNP